MAATKGSQSSPMCNLAVLDSLSESSIGEMADSWNVFCAATEALLRGDENSSFAADIVPRVRNLCGLGLQSLIIEHFLCSVEKVFEKNGASRFWKHFDAYSSFAVLDMEDLDQQGEMQDVLHTALEQILSEKQYQEKCLLVLLHALETCRESNSTEKGYSDAEQNYLLSKYQLTVSSVLMASLPRHFPDVLQWYFKGRLEELSAMMATSSENDDKLNVDDEGGLDYRRVGMDIDGTHYQRTILGNNKLVKNIGEVVRDLRNLGFTSMAEDAYASAIFLLLKAKVHELAGDDFRFSVLDSIKQWIQDVPLQFLHALLAYLGDSKSYGSPSSGLKSPLASHPYFRYCGNEVPSEGLIRWQLRLEYFAYETLQDLRIAKLFEIIVDYPDSSPAIEDLKQCLEYTGQHSKLVDSFIAALKYRLLTAGASTNDILHQYVSTIKALRTIDPAGVFLEAVGEPIREYLKGRKDTIKCIVTMLTDGAGGNPTGPGSTGDSLLEELNRDEENQESSSFDDDVYTDDKQAWINSQSWEPDPVEADPLKGSRFRRKVDILGMIVGIIGSKDQLVNEYRVMLAEKLLNKSDYDIDSEIRTLELLKIHFGEGSMQKCEIMLNDLIDSKRTNTNIKATVKQQPKPVADIGEDELSLDNVDATIISSNFWPPIQDEALNIPGHVDQILSDYAKRFNQIKTPRKLLWKRSLGTVKLELQFEDRTLPFTVTPLHAAIISQFEDQTSWTSKNLAAAVGVPVDILNRRIYFWINKGILAESVQESGDHTFTLVEAMTENGKAGVSSGNSEELLAGDEDGERSVASVEDQLRKEMTVYEKFIIGMLTNFGSMALDRIHNTLKMFCIGDPSYDKSLQQLQSFLGGLVAEEKLEFRDGIINPNQSRFAKLQRTLCLAFSNRAEARARLSDLSEALRDCEEALGIEKSHFKTLLCKGKVLLSLNRYSVALHCFERANLDPQAGENSDAVNGLLKKCKKLESLSRNGALDVSDWVLSGFRGKMPELAEYVGAVEIKNSGISGRGLFATKNVESGGLMLVTRAVAVDRAIMPQDSGENAHLVIWKSFVDKVMETASKCEDVSSLISNLSSGEDEALVGVPEIAIFRPEAEVSSTTVAFAGDKLDKGRLLSILDVNSMLEDAISAKVLGKNADYQGVGLWILASFINHSCDPNVRRLHIGDHVVVHAARDVKAGEELTFAYFDVLSPLSIRKEMAKNWGFGCRCKRCTFEENVCYKQEMREIEMALGKGVVDMGNLVYRLEEGMRRWMVRGKGKGYLRASFWEAYSKVFGSEKVMRKWGRKIPAAEAAVDSVVDVVGSDERIVKVYVEGLRRGGINGVVEMEKAIKLGRGIYGKVMKKQALRALLQID
ncbi:anaphase-promoting complex/cyclosome 2 [Perilla frutescens var. hirtella]|nr:anaphase-promoting complex/cyclosome 2 [Perilla frutescens var. hirtella]